MTAAFCTVAVAGYIHKVHGNRHFHFLSQFYQCHNAAFEDAYHFHLFIAEFFVHFLGDFFQTFGDFFRCEHDFNSFFHCDEPP